MSRAPLYVTVDLKTGVLRPGDAYAAEQISKLTHGQEFFARLSRITATGKDERAGIRGLWWAGCTLLSENTDDPEWNTSRKVHNNILTALGFTRKRFRADGTYELVPVSTAEDAFDDEEMMALQEMARAWTLEHVGFDPWQMWVDEQEAAKGNAASRR